MPIELRHLRYFIAVANELHFSRAAERLGISQPPLSQQIRQLEDTIGTPLLCRSNRRVELTEAGRAFVTEARAILRHSEHAVELARRVARGEAGELRIGFTASTPLSRHIPRTISAFRRERPDVHLQLEELPTLQQIDALLGRRLHLGIMRPAVLPPTLEAQALFSDPLVAVMPSEHAHLRQLDRAYRLPLNALADEPFVVFSHGAGTGIRDQVVALCVAAGFNPRISQEAAEPSTIIGLVAAGMGVSVLPASYEHIHIEGVSYVPLQDPGAESGIRMVRRRDDHSPLVDAFARLLLAEARR
ncbi:LysR substrate-binding domain-containing protein [Acidihalobacter ferrooxydans]|uniref:LysR family transcriptional regulator n=1 Tax=Acidihalobacter ferrooxydans TaxID=1765967 RepID=A0A1P8UEL0_9GAMM|nr:LysR substrate-binding domain-containing protein [Acidihalobacter ferrooxydans]APZ42271.1 LysR family transcriptional regulator [Acidihalobacter ferrooxydans]